MTTANRLRGSAPALSVGIGTADPLRLGDELESIAREGVEIVHIDVMDGVYCPPAATAAPALARAIPAGFTVDVHLMVEEPLGKVEAWVDAGADIVTFQLEGARHPRRVLESLADSGVTRGVAIAPGTPLALLEPLLDALELVLVLTVDPGWPGPWLGATTLARLAQLRALAGEGDLLLGIDGGINRGNLGQVLAAGPDLVVVGSAIFDGTDPAANARWMLAEAAGA